MNFFFVPCGAWVLFLSIRSQCLFPEGSHQMKMCLQLTYCTFAIFPSKDLLMCFLFQTMTANLPVCVLVWRIHWRNMLLIHLASSIKHIHLAGSARWGGGDSGIPVYPQKIRKIPKNTQNSSKYTQNYTQVYFIHEIQRKWYTEYPYLSCTDLKSPCIPYTQNPWPTLTWIVRRAECDIRQQELSEFYKEAENYCCKTKSWPSYVL